jgi:hypothetical protein
MLRIKNIIATKISALFRIADKKTAIRNMDRIICCCVIFPLRGKITQQHLFSICVKGISKIRIADKKTAGLN